jgi:Protein-glutamine gamma-glutamyltransferase
LGGPQVFTFESLGAFASHVRVQRRICRAAARTAVAFKTLAAERPDQYWTYDEEAGFLLQPGQSLSDALRAATQPSVTGQLYDFSCYRASEYVILLGLSEELEQVNPAQLAQLEARCRRRAIRSREFHDVFLDEFGSHDSPVPARYFVPGDRLWFRNPDERSSDALGYEGSWVIYMGGGLFSNFWKHEQPYTLEDKCIEIFHWRDGAYQDERQEWQMDEARVEACVAATQADAAARTRVLQRMMRLRDPQGVYADGGCPRACGRSAARCRYSRPEHRRSAAAPPQSKNDSIKRAKTSGWSWCSMWPQSSIHSLRTWGTTCSRSWYWPRL